MAVAGVPLHLFGRAGAAVHVLAALGPVLLLARARGPRDGEGE